MDGTHFDTIIAKYPTLSGLMGQLRPNVHFRRFEEALASTICGSSYVIPFISYSHCLVTRRSNGKWVLPGGTLEPGETWEEAGRRELKEETACTLGELNPIGMYYCVSQCDRARLPHLPHPEHVRVVSWADVVQNTSERLDPDTNSSIVEVRTVHYRQAAELFGPESADFGELYQFAHEFKQSQSSRS